VPVEHLKPAARGPLRLLVEWLDHCRAIPGPGDVDVIAGGPPCQDVSVPSSIGACLKCSRTITVLSGVAACAYNEVRVVTLMVTQCDQAV
jgi:hypothetical protein